MADLKQIDWNGTSYNVGGVTSVNGKTGAVTVKEPTQKYIHYFKTDWASYKLCCLFYIISTVTPADVANTSSSTFKSFFQQECTKDTPAICNGVYVTTITSSTGVGVSAPLIPISCYYANPAVAFNFVVADPKNYETTSRQFPYVNFSSNTTYLYSVPLS